MKKIIFSIMICVSVGFIIWGSGVRKEPVSAKLYVVDAQMLQLIPIEIKINASNPEYEAKAVLSELIRGFDSNPKIRRLIPKIKKCMEVRVKNQIAYVDITDKMIENHPDSRDLEKLTVYSIVNSLTSIDGIDAVRFTVDGKIRKRFMGYLDMRETFFFEKFI